MDLRPVSESEFKSLVSRKLKLTEEECLSYFKNEIMDSKRFAIGPHYWLIPDQSEMKVAACSPNIDQLTPYSHEEWLNKDFSFWIGNMHPEDREFAVSGLGLSLGIHESLGVEKSENIQVNIFIRVLDQTRKFRWVLVQFPKRLFDQNGKVTSTFILITDLSHITQSFSKMLTVMDTSNNKNILFATKVGQKELMPLSLPQISKRELELLQLMAKGLNSPQIAEVLFISYHTVENHKRNLRKKTNTKTSAQLIDYVWRNNLL